MLGARLRELVGSVRAAEAELDAVLERTINDARAAWPGVVLADDVFVAHLARFVSADASLVEQIEALATSDLYLACACARRDPRALACFDERYLQGVGASWSGKHSLAAVAGDVQQALRVRLLVGEDGAPPRIATYSGKGGLSAWVRMAATRLALNLRKSENRHASVAEPDDVAAFGIASDPELEYLKTKYAGELSDALRATLRALPDRSASILRLHYQQAMSIDAIGVMYKVSGRTVQRWLAEARDAILVETRRLLREQIGLADSQLESLIQLVRSRLDISIYRHLSAP